MPKHDSAKTTIVRIAAEAGGLLDHGVSPIGVWPGGTRFCGQTWRSGAGSAGG